MSIVPGTDWAVAALAVKGLLGAGGGRREFAMDLAAFGLCFIAV